MKNSVNKNIKRHPVLLFWLGVLTGAVGIGLIFFYTSMNPNQFESAVLQSTRSTLQLSPLRTTTTTINSYTALPSPTGNYTYLPSPTGN
jgi:hypothetical protein